jgi:hypothetical protein
VRSVLNANITKASRARTTCIACSSRINSSTAHGNGGLPGTKSQHTTSMTSASSGPSSFPLVPSSSASVASFLFHPYRDVSVPQP